MSYTLRLILGVCGTTLAALAASTVPAHADLRVCNQTGNLVAVALGYRSERGWQSEGWWNIEPGGTCQSVYTGDLDRPYYYLFAVDDIGGGAWEGNAFMCTRDETFTIFGVEDCLARGYERTGFVEIDVEGRSDWTVNLTENEITSADTP